MFSLLGLVAMLMMPSDLPVGSAQSPVPTPHFPDAYHAYVWRNWQVVPLPRIAAAIGATTRQVHDTGIAMGLPEPLKVSADQQMRSHLTVIRRNWHLLPYSQMLKLLGWSADELAYTLREDDFLYIKLGSLKPNCAPVQYVPATPEIKKREHEIAATVHSAFPIGMPMASLFDFVQDLKRPDPYGPLPTKGKGAPTNSAPRFCYSYFALYGDPLLDKRADPYPEGYLKRLKAAGVNGVWLQGVLTKLAPYPWDTHQSAQYEQRLANLKTLVARARKHGIGIYLYMNEPRALPLTFFAAHPELTDARGVIEGDHAALCTSAPQVQKYISESVATICRAVPDLAGFFTITGSENLTSCWSHGAGKNCPRCAPRGAGTVISEVNGLIQAGIKQAGSKTRLIAWDWGWPEDAARDIISKLPKECALMSVSEWDLPIHRGGIESVVGEYSVSAVGPGPRATRHWQIAKELGLQTFAKIQAANSWEMSAVPYVPALANTAKHIENLKKLSLNGTMLGWTLGGYPSPNLETVSAVFGGATADEALKQVAQRRFGPAADNVVKAWKAFSTAFSEFPFHIGLVYTAPMQHGPANLLWEKPTGYHASMVGFPYDDLDGWRAVYPPEVFSGQLQKIADGFDAAIAAIKVSTEGISLNDSQRSALDAELRIAETVAIHCGSVANQGRFITLRAALNGKSLTPTQRSAAVTEARSILNSEIESARRMAELQSQDARLGFEASNQYYYVGVDLAEKILNCTDLRDRWLPAVSR